MNIFRRIFGSSKQQGGSISSGQDAAPPHEAPGDGQVHPMQAGQETTILADVNEDGTQPTLAGFETGKLDESPDAPHPEATRPLSMEAVIASANGHLRFGQTTDTGMVRNNNQDAAFSLFATSRSVDKFPDFGLFIVADGMGGHHDGEKAAAMTARIVAAEVMRRIYLPLILVEDEREQQPIVEALDEAVRKANKEILSTLPEGGTTLTAVAVLGNLAYIAHVGDSRVYLVGTDGIEQVTRDHSWVQRMIELDQLTPEQAATHPQKNVLYRALGQSETLEVDTLMRRLRPKSRLLLCSDGLWNLVDEVKIMNIVMNQSISPQEACDKLVALANTNGGSDNITTILLETPG